MDNECKSIKCANCYEEHLAFSRSCAIKHTKNIPFPEVRKIVESYMGTKTYANVTQKVNQPPQDSTSIDKYLKLIEKLINLKANEWLTFQENLKRVHSTETKQSESCIKMKVNTNTNTDENPKTTEQTKEKRQRSPVRPQDINKDINENKTKDITIKKHNAIKRITQTQPTPIITSNKFEEIEDKTPINKSQPKKSQKSKLNEENNPMEHQRSKGQLL